MRCPSAGTCSSRCSSGVAAARKKVTAAADPTLVSSARVQPFPLRSREHEPDDDGQRHKHGSDVRRWWHYQLSFRWLCDEYVMPFTLPWLSACKSPVLPACVGCVYHGRCLRRCYCSSTCVSLLLGGGALCGGAWPITTRRTATSFLRTRDNYANARAPFESSLLGATFSPWHHGTDPSSPIPLRGPPNYHHPPAVRVPFPLTLRFRGMLQRGIELSTLGSSW